MDAGHRWNQDARMQARTAAPAALAVSATATFLLLATAVVEVRVRDAVLLLVLPLAFTAAGVLAVRHRPGPAATALAAVGVLHLAAFALDALAVTTGAAWFRGGAAAAATSTYLLGFVALLALAWALPAQPRLPPRARDLLRGLALLALVAPPTQALLGEDQRHVLDLDGWPPSAPAAGLAPQLPDVSTWAAPLLAAPVVAAVVLAARWYRARAAQRRRLGWPAAALMVSLSAVAVQALVGRDLPGGLRDLFVVVALGTAPFAVLPSILAEDHVQDERMSAVVRSSLVLAMLWLIAGICYTALVTVAGVGRSDRRWLAVGVVAALALASLLPPARRALSRTADRLALGRPVDGYALLRDFGAGLGGSEDVADLCSATAATVRRGLDAQWAQMTLQSGESATVGAVFTPSALICPVTVSGEQVGQLRCGRRRRGLYSERDREAMAALADQVALAVSNHRLSAELAQRLHELSSSRHRLAVAADEERRRIERDLHDGAQQDLVALLCRVELARTLLGYSVGAAEETLDELRGDVAKAIASLRQTVLGIHPPVLTDSGLHAAVLARVAELPIDVTVDCDPTLRTRRFSPSLETAAYYVVVESLTNVLKHAGAGSAVVHLRCVQEWLEVEVIDHGTGGARREAGSGLAGLGDRVAAVGGALRVTSPIGRGTAVCARLPLPASVEAP
jgi:signal transduction histidine kinase